MFSKQRQTNSCTNSKRNISALRWEDGSSSNVMLILLLLLLIQTFLKCTTSSVMTQGLALQTTCLLCTAVTKRAVYAVPVLSVYRTDGVSVEMSASKSASRCCLIGHSFQRYQRNFG